MKITPNKSSSDILRQKAEDLLKKKSSVIVSSLSEVEILKLLYELEIHQIELELSNEELSQSRSAAQEAADKYIELYDFAPVGYFTLSKEGKILGLNLCCSQLLGKERALLINTKVGSFVTDETKQIFNSFLKSVFQGNSPKTCEVYLSGNSGIAKIVQMTGKLMGNSEQCMIAITDISERKSILEKLKRSESQLKEEVKQRTLQLETANNALKKELNHRKESQKLLKQSLQKYQSLNSYLDRTREDERKSVARIIHDNLGQTLTFLNVELTLLLKILDNTNPLILPRIDSMLQLVNQSIITSTNLITELRPIVLDNLGLLPALQQLFSDFQKNTGIQVVIRIKKDTMPVKGATATAVYQVVSEGLANIRLHSGASDLTVTATADQSAFFLTMFDNGRGITQTELKSTDSFGIIGMKERILGIKGKITIKGEPGKGTTFSLKVPLAGWGEKAGSWENS
ncbi:MAG: ATP-binding protein [Bacteroidota bacterium]